MNRLQAWCDDALTPAEFESRLLEGQGSDDIGTALLADELLPLWKAASKA
jgi:hypothetical protein